MKTKVIRLNEDQIFIIRTALESQLRVLDPELIKRNPSEQAQADLYAKKIHQIIGKL